MPLPSLLPRMRQQRFCSRTLGDFWSGVAIAAQQDGRAGRWRAAADKEAGGEAAPAAPCKQPAARWAAAYGAILTEPPKAAAASAPHPQCPARGAASLRAAPNSLRRRAAAPPPPRRSSDGPPFRACSGSA